jgi:hypothetical protein
VVELELPEKAASESLYFWVACRMDYDSDGAFEMSQGTACKIQGKPGSTIMLYYDKTDVTLPGSGLFGATTPRDRYSKPVIGTCVEVQVTLDKTLKHVEVKESDIIRGADASPQDKEEEYTVRHSVTIQNGWQAGVETRVEGKVGTRVKMVDVEASLAVTLKAHIERSESRTYEESRTSRRKVTIPGNGKPYRIIFLESFRTGTVTTIINGKENKVPFEFREGWDLQTREVKD